jgi:hypothetical protein
VFSFLKLSFADIIVFQIRQVTLTCDLNRLEACVLNITREKDDPTTLEVIASLESKSCDKALIRFDRFNKSSTRSVSASVA